MRLWRRGRKSTDWELRTSKGVRHELFLVRRALIRVYVCDLFGSPVDAHQNIVTIEKAMLLVDILNARSMSADALEEAVTKLRGDLPPPKGKDST